VPEAPSLYRRHRPRTFADVVGQEPVVRTLRNAVEQEKVHHAYLFVGSRGTGKTSMAKILAACLNCERGPTTEPCGVCESCTAIANATSLDVIEMDAASNNSVDDIRDLRERVAFAPVSGRHKVYILDEAHMLSPQAWNAFLKTLEEPPPNTLFVLCTTEAQKVLPTVVDRCHRFDFGRPGADQVAEVLRRVAEAEGIQLPDAARALIARKASGSFRDALGNLEQLVTYSGPQIQLDDVLAVLGVADAELLFAATSAVGEGDVAGALRAVQRLADSGRDPGQFIDDLEEHVRGLLVVQALGEVPSELRVTPEQDERLAEQATAIGRAQVVRLLDLLAEALEARKAGADARVVLELALVKAAAPELDPSHRALLARIERLEAGGAPAPAPVEPPPAAPAPRRAEPSSPPTESAAPAPSGPAAAAAPVAASPEPEPLDLEAIRPLWKAVLETVRAAPEHGLLANHLDHATLAGLSDGALVLTFAEDFSRRQAEKPGNRAVLAQAIQTVTGRSVKLLYDRRERDEPSPGLSDDELVERVMAEFDAEELPADDDPEGGP
jgi:DNA polymerase III subunit gamma/tau